MSEGTTSEAEVVRLRQSIETQMRRRILEAIEVVLEEELTEALGTARYERGEVRRGYRNGHQTRRITTAMGLQTLAVPRARIAGGDGSSREFRSQALPRYARRTREVDEAILGAYLAGANSRRIRKALMPLLGEVHLSKSAVSRVASRLKELFRRWSERDLSKERTAILFLDGFHLKVRMARRVVSVPVLAVLGVAEDGTKHLVALTLAASEAGAHWSSLIADLQRRGLEAPVLILSDGHAGLRKAIELWPEARVQRCTWHKWQNLVEHCPVHARPELKRDYDRIVYAKDGLVAREAYSAFVTKWRSLCPAVARSLEEAGEPLLTFYAFPKAMWRALRTTNSLENLNREFRRRTKTQASFSTEEAGVTLLYGLVAFGQIQLRKIDGHRHVSGLLAPVVASAA
ncbi:MAG: IS256 family transposase [Thermoanaerobaculia bacterium]